MRETLTQMLCTYEILIFSISLSACLCLCVFVCLHSITEQRPLCSYGSSGWLIIRCAKIARPTIDSLVPNASKHNESVILPSICSKTRTIFHLQSRKRSHRWRPLFVCFFNQSYGSSAKNAVHRRKTHRLSSAWNRNRPALISAIHYRMLLTSWTYRSFIRIWTRCRISRNSIFSPFSIWITTKFNSFIVITRQSNLSI